MITLRSVATREQARKSEKHFKSGHGRSQVDRLLETEKEQGRLVRDAEKEGIIQNPFTVENGAPSR